MWQDAPSQFVIKITDVAETYMTLATDGSLVSWSTVGPHCETHFFSCRFLHHLNVCLFLRVTIILFWCKELAWQSDISTDFSVPQKPQIALETRRIKQVHHKKKRSFQMNYVFLTSILMLFCWGSTIPAVKWHFRYIPTFFLFFLNLTLNCR